MELRSDICMGSNLNFKLPNIIHVLWIVNMCVSAVIIQKCFHFSHPKKEEKKPKNICKCTDGPKTWITIQCSVLNTYIIMNETWNILWMIFRRFYLKIHFWHPIWRMKTEKGILVKAKKKRKPKKNWKWKWKIPKKSYSILHSIHIWNEYNELVEILW